MTDQSVQDFQDGCLHIASADEVPVIVNKKKKKKKRASGGQNWAAQIYSSKNHDLLLI